MKKQIRLLKNRSDIGAGTRGSDMGIDAIEIAAINSGNNYFDRHFFKDIVTNNESIYNKKMDSFAKRIHNVVDQCTRVSDAVIETFGNNQFPLVMSGDHSSALGTISGVKTTYNDKRLGAIWIDAHADLHSPYTSPSGNIHGMPLAAAIADDNLKYQQNELKDDVLSGWENMKRIGCDIPKLKGEDIVYFGVRSTEEPEDKQIEKYGIKNYMVHEVRYRGIKTCVEEALGKLKDCDIIYLSFDVDSMDRDLISYGTGTPVEKGFDQYEVIEIINRLLASGKVVAFEIVEINPLLDLKGNKMAETAFEVLDAVTPNMG